MSFVARAKAGVIRTSQTTVPRLLHRSAVMRWFAGWIGTAICSAYRREYCRVTYDDGWVHQYREGVVVRETLGGATPARMRATTERIFLWNATLDVGDVVIDVGAGIGEEAPTLAARVGPTGRVIAVEAHRRTYELLVRNCALNGLDNVVPVHSAVTDEVGTVRINDDFHSEARAIGDVGDEVPATTLPVLLAEHGVERVALLKMNIEGAERSAMRGLAPCAERVDQIVVSCHDFLTDAGLRGVDARTRTVVDELLRGYGFAVRSRPDPLNNTERDYLYATRTD